MSGDRLTRRSLLAAGTASLLMPLVAKAEIFTPIHHVGGVEARDGVYRSDTRRSLGDGSAWAFTGIRYARAARFAPPVAVTKAEQLKGDSFGPACPQGGDRYQPQSEDCLFLNVWTPDIDD